MPCSPRCPAPTSPGTLRFFLWGQVGPWPNPSPSTMNGAHRQPTGSKPAAGPSQGALPARCQAGDPLPPAGPISSAGSHICHRKEAPRPPIPRAWELPCLLVTEFTYYEQNHSRLSSAPRVIPAWVQRGTPLTSALGGGHSWLRSAAPTSLAAATPESKRPKQSGPWALPAT